MNAATQRRLTPWLAGGIVLLGAGLLALLSGVGRGVHWDPPHRAAPLPATHPVALPPPPPLDGYAAVWQHPLFNSDRKPLADDTAAGAHVSLGDLELTGIILTPGLRMALLRNKGAGDKDADAEVRVRQGDALPDGSWKLIGLKPRSAVFASASGRTVLELPAGAPIDAPAPAAGGTPPPPATPNLHRPAQGAADVHRANAPQPAAGLRTGQPPVPPPPQGAQLQRMLKLKATILKQRARQHRDDDGDH